MPKSTKIGISDGKWNFGRLGYPAGDFHSLNTFCRSYQMMRCKPYERMEKKVNSIFND